MAMRGLIGVVMVAFGLVFVGVSMKMNYFAGLRQGETPEEGQVFAWLAVAVSGANAGLPFAIAWSSWHRQWAVVVVAALLLALFLIYSLGSALGYAAGNRGAVVSGRDTLKAGLKAALKQESDLRAELKPVANLRTVGVIEAEMARQRQDRLWTATKECSDATAPASRQFCQAYYVLEGELAGSVLAVRVRTDLQRVTAEIAKLRGQGAGRDSDPQASLLSRLFGISVEHVRSFWAVLSAVLVELGCAFLPFIGLTMLGVRHAPSEPTGEMIPIAAHLLPPQRKPARKAAGRGRRTVAEPRVPMELPPLRSAEFGEDGSLRISDQRAD